MPGELRGVLSRAWATLPQLFAIYLAGRLAHDLLFDLASHVAPGRPLLSVVILPLALLAKLASLIGMLIVLRPAMGDPAARAEAAPRDPRREFLAVLASSMLPFIAFYTAWKYLLNDFDDYRLQTFHSTLGSGKGSFVVDATSLTIAIAAGMLIARLILKKVRDRVPNWVVLVECYLEAAWVYLLIGNWLSSFNVKSWLQSRRIVVWAAEARHELMSHIPGAELIWNPLAWLTGQVVAVFLVPLAWLAVAGIIYALVPSTNWADARALLGGTRWGSTVEVLGRRRPLHFIGWPFREQATAWRDAMYVIVHVGIVPIALFVLGYTGLLWIFGNDSEVPPSPGWLQRMIYALVGPHPSEWWSAVSPIEDAVGFVGITLELCLIVWVYALFARKVRARSMAAAPELNTSSPQ